VTGVHADEPTVSEIHRNLPPGELYEHAILYEKDSIAEKGTLVAYSGVKTGRSPKDKRMVRNFPLIALVD
jgi:phosphoenolpyruvate carboxykinase (ATP)